MAKPKKTREPVRQLDPDFQSLYREISNIFRNHHGFVGILDHVQAIKLYAFGSLFTSIIKQNPGWFTPEGKIRPQGLAPLARALGLKDFDIPLFRVVAETHKLNIVDFGPQEKWKASVPYWQPLLHGYQKEFKRPQNSKTLLKQKTLENVRYTELPDASGKAIKGVYLMRVEMPHLRPSAQAVYNKTQPLYVFLIIDTRTQEKGGTGCFGHLVIDSITEGSTLGGLRNADYSIAFRDPANQNYPPEDHCLIDSMNLSHGMEVKYSLTPIKRGGMKYAFHQKDPSKLSDQVLKIRGLAHRFFNSFEYEVITSNDVGTTTEHLIEMAKYSKELCGDDKLPLKGGHPTILTSSVGYAFFKTLISQGIWPCGNRRHKLVGLLEGFGGVGMYFIEHLAKDGLFEKLYIIEPDQTKYEKFMEEDFGGRSKIEFIEQVLAPKLAKKGLTIEVLPCTYENAYVTKLKALTKLDIDYFFPMAMGASIDARVHKLMRRKGLGQRIKDLFSRRKHKQVHALPLANDAVVEGVNTENLVLYSQLANQGGIINVDLGRKLSREEFQYYLRVSLPKIVREINIRGKDWATTILEISLEEQMARLKRDRRVVYSK